MNHFIKKQIIDVNIQNGLDALAIQDRINERFWIDLLPVIEAEFDKAASDGVDYRIELLEIDLGNISEEMIESGEWASLLKQQLSEKLKEILGSPASESQWRLQKNYANIFDQWYYFLEHGYLPWNAPRPGEQWLAQVLIALGTEFESADKLKKLINEKKAIAQRIVVNHEVQFLVHLIELLTAHKQNELPALIHAFSEWIKPILTDDSLIKRMDDREIISEIWIRTLRNAAYEKTGKSTRYLIKLLIKDLLAPSATVDQRLVTLLGSTFSHEILESAFKDIVSALLDDKGESTIKKAESTGNKEEERLTFLQEQDAAIESSDKTAAEKVDLINAQLRESISTNFSVSRTQTEDENISGPDSIDEDGIYINHAGIVLVHPFLHTFFRKVELVREGGFVDLESQQRAICLLHELAGTSEPSREYDLVLPKLLCSWPLQKPLNTTIEFTAEEIKEMMNVLQAVIEQWEILKNSSTAALQQTFLQRGGKLFQRNTQWWLQIEPNSMDVLLDHLPWTISMIKLPWMKELLRVEWR